MKHGYTCSCGWTLNRNDLTRREYASRKEEHAEHCTALRKELEQSRKAGSSAQ